MQCCFVQLLMLLRSFGDDPIYVTFFSHDTKHLLLIICHAIWIYIDGLRKANVALHPRLPITWCFADGFNSKCLSVLFAWVLYPLGILGQT